MTLTRSVTFQAAWDRRDPDPHKNYGVHGVQIDFVLSGPEGAVYFPVMTGWMLPEVTEWHRTLPTGMTKTRMDYAGLPFEFSIHSRTPREGWDGQRKEQCEFLNGPCWVMQGSGLARERIWDAMLRKGDAGFWAALEELYRLNLTGPQPNDI